MRSPLTLRKPDDQSAIGKAFPLCEQKDFEGTVNQSPFVVGVDNNYPAELRERLSAALISYHLQLTSVDYARKNIFQKLNMKKILVATRELIVGYADCASPRWKRSQWG